MKTLMLIMAVVVICTSAEAQEAKGAGLATPIGIAQDKTTTLVFPCSVSYVDRGTPDVLVKALKEAPDKLLLKAGKVGFAATSLSVLTTDGRVYCFSVRFEPLAPTLVKLVSLESSASGGEDSRGSGLTEWEVKRTAEDMLQRGEAGSVKTKRLWEMELGLQHIYIRKDVLFFSLLLTNHSYVPYQVDALRFVVKDRKRSKRTAQQEQELTPIYAAGMCASVAGGSQVRLVIALPAFTLPGRKKCLIELSEKNGGRWLNLKLTNAKLVGASLYP